MNFEINDTKEGLIKGEQENSQPITSSDYIHGETKKQKGYIFFLQIYGYQKMTFL